MARQGGCNKIGGVDVADGWGIVPWKEVIRNLFEARTLLEWERRWFFWIEADVPTPRFATEQVAGVVDGIRPIPKPLKKWSNAIKK